VIKDMTAVDLGIRVVIIEKREGWGSSDLDGLMLLEGIPI